MSSQSYEQRVYERALVDFPFFCKVFLRIRDKQTKKMIPMVLNEAQLRTWERIKYLLKNKGYAWILLVKARQQGSSTMAMALAAWVVFLQPEQTALSVAHKEKEGKEIFEKLERMREEMPEEIRLAKAPGSRTGDALKLKKLNTTAIRDSAENVVVGRGLSPKFIHFTEVPSYPNAEKTFGGVTPSVEGIHGGIIFVETTVETVGDWIHEEWDKAENGDSNFDPLFNGWFLSAEYREAWTEDDSPLTPDELAYAERYGLDAEQSLWHRKKLKAYGAERMGREYPSSAEEAFRAGGKTYFDNGALRYYEQLVQKFKPIREGFLDIADGKSSFRNVKGGPWRVYKRPDRERTYVVTGDPAGGTARDFSSADIVDVESLEQVASFRGKLDPDEFAYQLASMGYAYNTALIACEKNGEGRASIIALHKTLMYPRIFYHIKEDAHGKGMSTDWGWVTSVRTRPTMLSQLEELLRKKEMRLRDPRTVRELWSFVRVDSSQTMAKAASGAYDDSVMSIAIAATSEVRSQAFNRSEVVQSNHNPLFVETGW